MATVDWIALGFPPGIWDEKKICRKWAENGDTPENRKWGQKMGRKWGQSQFLFVKL